MDTLEYALAQIKEWHQHFERQNGVDAIANVAINQLILDMERFTYIGIAHSGIVEVNLGTDGLEEGGVYIGLC